MLKCPSRDEIQFQCSKIIKENNLQCFTGLLRAKQDQLLRESKRHLDKRPAANDWSPPDASPGAPPRRWPRPCPPQPPPRHGRLVQKHDTAVKGWVSYGTNGISVIYIIPQDCSWTAGIDKTAGWSTWIRQWSAWTVFLKRSRQRAACSSQPEYEPTGSSLSKCDSLPLTGLAPISPLERQHSNLLLVWLIPDDRFVSLASLITSNFINHCPFKSIHCGPWTMRSWVCTLTCGSSWRLMISYKDSSL